jgi:hypothetical protein
MSQSSTARYSPVPSTQSNIRRVHSLDVTAGKIDLRFHRKGLTNLFCAVPDPFKALVCFVCVPDFGHEVGVLLGCFLFVFRFVLNVTKRFQIN